MGRADETAESALSEAERQAVLARIRPTPVLDQAADAGLALEAIVEDLATKQALFARLEPLLAADALLATNTSSLSVTALAAPLEHPGRLAGMHFFNPATRMKLVEIVSGLATDPAVALCLFETAQAWGKVAVHARSTPGFIVNRVARPYYAEALRVLAERAADAATLDAVLREAGRFPMGPFELMDLIGNDVNFAVTRSVHEASFGDRRYVPSLIQQELVVAGRLGRKTGRGFYDYGEGATRAAPAQLGPRKAPGKAVVHGRLGPAEGLVERLGGAGLSISRIAGDGTVRLGQATLALSDGRPATIRAAEDRIDNLVLFDLAFDYATTSRLALARADQCSESAFDAAAGALQSAGIEVSQLDDVAGLVVLRTVCMLANEAADAVLQGVASETDVDSAMRNGTNYPIGPLAWARTLGLTRVVRTLENLARHYGEERYRLSPWLRRHSVNAAG